MEKRLKILEFELRQDEFCLSMCFFPSDFFIDDVEACGE